MKTIKRLLAILLSAMLAVSFIPQAFVMAEETAADGLEGAKTLQFVEHSAIGGSEKNYSSTDIPVEVGIGTYGNIMGTKPGYYYFFETVLSSSAEDMDAFADNGFYLYTEYRGWGNNGQQYYIGLYKASDGTWSIVFYKSGLKSYWPQYEIASYKLSDAQIAKISNGGLKAYLVYNGDCIFTAYVECDGVINRIGGEKSTQNNKNIYAVKNLKGTNVGSSVKVKTTGYFYGTGYTGAQAAQSVLSAEDSSENKTYTKFKSVAGYNGGSGNFKHDKVGNATLNDVMGTAGYEYLFHSKLEASSAVMNAYTDTKNPLTQIMYAAASEQYLIGLYKYQNTWEIRFHCAKNWWAQWHIKTVTLSDTQIADIQNSGLDVFLVNSGTTLFSAYVERDGVADLIGSVDSANNPYNDNDNSADVSNRLVTEIRHSANNTDCKIATTGYFYGAGYTGATAAQGLLGLTTVPVLTTTGTDTVVSGLKESYKVGDSCEFNVKQYAGDIVTVKVNGTTVSPAAQGVYKLAVSQDYAESFVISVDRQTFTPIIKSDGAIARQIGAGECNFGDQTGNFIFHTKFKYSGIVGEDGTINYPATETSLGTVTFKGWGTNGYAPYIINVKADSSSVTLNYSSGENGYNNITRTLTETQIQKMADDGLDLYFVHTQSYPYIFSVYYETGEENSLLAPHKVDNVDFRMNSEYVKKNTKVYAANHSGMISGASMITTGYKFSSDFGVMQSICEHFEKMTRDDIAVTDNVGISGLPEVCHLGDILKFQTELAPGTYITVNGSILAADSDGFYTFSVGYSEMDGITVDTASVTSDSFEKFITFTDNSELEYVGAKDKYIYRINYKSDLKTATNGNASSISTTLFANTVYTSTDDSGKETTTSVIDQIDLRLNLDDLSTPKLQLSRYKSGIANGYSETLYTLDAAQIAKIKTVGLNAYIVHEGANSKVYTLYVEDGNSGAVTKRAEMTAHDGVYQYQAIQTVIDGTHVTVEGFKYGDPINSAIAATELFWSDTSAVTGDINDDGSTDIRDLVTSKKILAGVSVNAVNKRAADIDMNRTFDSTDLAGIRKLLLTGEKKNSVAPLVYNANYGARNETSTLSSMNSRLFYRNSYPASTTVGGADPSVFKAADGKYVMFVTGASADQAFPVYTSTDLINWKKAGNITVVDENGSSAAVAAYADIWAMEAVYDADTGKYYLFFSATPEKFADGVNVRSIKVPYVAVGDSYTGQFELINHTDYKYADGSALSSKEGDSNLGYAEYLRYSVFDPYQLTAKMVAAGKIKSATAQHIKAIDFHPFVDADGDKYLYFSIFVDSGSVIAGVRMTDWTTPDYSTLSFLTENKAMSYERNDINEGPWMTEHNGKYYLTLSINGFGTDNYKIIQAVGDSPLGNFTKIAAEDGGIVIGADRIGEISGPGHHSIIEENGEMYIIYHVHNNPSDPSYSRHIVMDKLEWVTNSKGETVMYANGPTLNAILPLPSFVSGYGNISSESAVTATNVKNGSSVSGLTDKLINSKGSTWRSMSAGTNTFFNDAIAPDTLFTDEATINMTFDTAKTVRAIMIYNSSSTANAFDSVKRIEFTCADGNVRYIDNLAFSADNNTYTLAPYQGETQGDDKFVCGASVADFSELQVTSIKITVAPGEGKSEVGIGEIVVLGK